MLINDFSRLAPPCDEVSRESGALKLEDEGGPINEHKTPGLFGVNTPSDAPRLDACDNQAIVEPMLDASKSTVGGNRGAESKARGAVGLSVRSGWATAVLLLGRAHLPRVLDHRRIELSDPAFPESRQPHHAGAGALETDEVKVSQRVQIVRHCTQESVSKLLQNYRSRDCKVCCAALAVGSVIDPTTISNPHIRAHALEGRLFRTVLREALSASGLRCSVVIERRAYAEASAIVGLSEAELRHTVTNLGRGQSGPWRAEQKMAALVAWMTLATISREDCE
jgi:hypothetical protein